MSEGSAVAEHAVWASKTDATLSLSCGAFSAKLSADHPERGLASAAFHGRGLGGALLSVAIGAEGTLPTMAETYVRGVDHVSLHRGSTGFPFDAQLYRSARILQRVDGVAVTLTASLQTDLLDSAPRLLVRTKLDEAATGMLDGAAGVLTTTGGDTVVVAPHPSDATESDASFVDLTHELRLAPPFLEKGVIRRCRVAALVLAGLADQDAIDAAIDEFAGWPLPLTT